MKKKRKKAGPAMALRRTTRNGLIAVAVFVLLPAVIMLDRQYGRVLSEPVTRTAYADGDWQKYHNRTFRVNEVIDGDTLDVDIPDGKFPDTRVRLMGVDTPETKHPTVGKMYYGPEASAFAAQLALGQTVTLRLDTVGDIRDRYGRLLAYCLLPDGTVLNEALIAEGCGYAYLSFPHSQSARYEALMQQAMTQNKGLWQKAVRTDLPKWLRQKRPDLLRYP
jgi:endonuclease YncB( thermonuclease family)